MSKDLSERGVLSNDFSNTHTASELRDEPILISVQDGVYMVHEDYTGLIYGKLSELKGDFGKISSLTESEFFIKYGDPSQMVTLEEFQAEARGINALRDDKIHLAADIYNKAVDMGYAKDKIEYQGTQNYGRIERELNRKMQEYTDIPDVVADQINRLRGENNDLSYVKKAMDTRLADITNDLEQSDITLDSGARVSTPATPVQ